MTKSSDYHSMIGQRVEYIEGEPGSGVLKRGVLQEVWAAPNGDVYGEVKLDNGKTGIVPMDVVVDEGTFNQFEERYNQADFDV